MACGAALVALAGCGRPDPKALAEEYFGFEMKGRFDRQYRLISPDLRALEPRQAFLERMDRDRTKRVLMAVKPLNEPPKSGPWRAWFRVTWETRGRKEIQFRGLTIVQRRGRWWVADCPAARADATEAYQSGEPQQATRLVQRILRANPLDAEALDLLGFIYRDNPSLKNSLELAVDAHRQAVDLEPENPDWRISLGNDYRMLGWHKGAIEELKRAVKLDPRAAAYVWLGVAQAAGGRVSDAREAWKKAVQLDPQHALAQAYLEKTK